MVTVHTTIDGFRRALDDARRDGAMIGYVPTMGYLHDGHASLMSAAARNCDLAAASIFVNPLQFAATEDLSTYPRDLDHDLAICEARGVSHVLHPSVEEMYPHGPVLTTVTVADITARFEGAARPEHFAGVATVVAKLFSITGPCRAYFGEKDYQQLAVVRRMASDLSIPVEVVGCPTVREPDGLAMSSRNVYLDDAQRAAAPILHRTLLEARDAVSAGATPSAVRALMADRISTEPLAVLDYADLVDADTLEPLADTEPGAGTVDAPVAADQSAENDHIASRPGRLLIAVRFGTTRLLDNLAAP